MCNFNIKIIIGNSNKNFFLIKLLFLIHAIKTLLNKLTISYGIKFGNIISSRNLIEFFRITDNPGYYCVF